MMPLRIEDIETLPNDLAHYKQTVLDLIAVSPVQKGVAYLTIDERQLKAGQTLRLRGLHVDGLGAEGKLDMSVWATSGVQYECKQHWNDAKRCWYESAAGIGGMVMVSTPSGCRAWNKNFEGKIEKDGDCEKLRDQFPDEEATVLEDSVAYWCNAGCVHESMEMGFDTPRQFVRLSMPNTAPWYQGYTRNPKGVEPTGPIISMRAMFRPHEKEVVLKG
jgi:hypothetical protein